MQKPSKDTAAQGLIDKNAVETFSWPLFMIVVGTHVAALGAFWAFSWSNVIGWAIAHYVFSTVGVSLGLHRLYSHRSFEPVRWLDRVISVVATLCFQGSPTSWAAQHRVHHVLTECYGDPYSAKRGFLWSHVLWMFYVNPNGFFYPRARRLVADLKHDRWLVWLETNSTRFNVMILAALFGLCYAMGNIGLFFWLGPLRIVTVWHSVWLVNSWTHYAPLVGEKVGDRLRNSPMVSLLLGGDGDHEYHHNNPSSPRHSGRRLNLDHGYWLLKALASLGLVKLRPVVSTKDVA